MTLWTPAHLPGSPRGYSAHDSGRIEIDGGVQRIFSFTGFGNALTAATGERPVYDAVGKTFTFDGVNDVLTGTQPAFLSGNESVTVIHMGRKVARTAGDHIGGVITNGGASGTAFSVTTSNVAGSDDVLNLRLFNGRVDTGFAASVGTEFCLIAEYNGTTHGGSTARVNGSPRTVTAASPSNVMAFTGAHELVWGAVRNAGVISSHSSYAARAMIVVDGAISDEDAERVEGWWAHEFGQTALLPADHPYKTVPPELPTDVFDPAVFDGAVFEVAGGAGAQDLSVAAFTAPASFPDAAVSPGPVGVEVGAFVAPPVFPALDVSQGAAPPQELVAALFTGRPSFGGVTVAPGPVALSVAAFGPPAAFPGLTVDPGGVPSQVLTVAAFAPAPTFGGLAVAPGPVGLSVAAFTARPVFPGVLILGSGLSARRAARPEASGNRAPLAASGNAARLAGSANRT